MKESNGDKLEPAKPITPGDEVKLDPAKFEALNDAQVQMVFKKGLVAVVILGAPID